MKKLLIFDASNYMFRAFYAAPPMNNSAGFPTNALHFFTSMVLAVIHRIKPDVIAMACERRGKKFRHALYADYKGQREAPPEDLQKQFPYFRQITDAMGIPSYDAETFEADDVIATLTQQACKAGYQVVIASSDKDLMQLVKQDGSVIMLDAMSKSRSKEYRVVTYDDVVARFNVEPERVADVLALAGDTIDNIPGCKGIGEKTAGKLIAEYGSLENLMARRGEIKKPAQKANLEAFAANAELSKKLTTLVFDVPVKLEETGMKPDPSQIVPLFSSLELHRLLTDILGPEYRPDPTVPRVGAQSHQDSSSDEVACEAHPEEKKSQEIPANANPAPCTPVALIRPFVKTTVINSDEALLKFRDHILQQPLAMIPLWLSEKADDRRLLGMAISTPTQAIYVPIYQERTLFSPPTLRESTEKLLIELLTDDHIFKVVYGVKSLYQYAQRLKFALNIDLFFDVEIAAYLTHPERKELTLAACAEEYLGQRLIVTQENWLGSGKSAVQPTSFSSAQIADFAGLWAQCALQLAEKLPIELEHHQLSTPFREIDMKLAPVLAEMEYEGIRLDVDGLHDLSAAFDAELKRLDGEIHSFGTESFNINSTKELAHFLFDTLGIVPGTKKNRQHGLSTDQDTLESIDHPIAQLILNYRTISKLRSTYSETLVQQADPVTHRLHGKFNACVTATTRLSSSDPNLQNIPSRDEIGRRIKRTFVPREGWSFVSADYSQIELRLMAAFSKEPVLCEAYRNGEDVHARTAASLFDIPIEQVTRTQRQLAKTINFGLLYGMGVQKLARETGYSKTEAKSFLKKFHEQFPTLSAFFDAQVEIARQHGETRTLLGHRRPVRELYSLRPMERAFGERIALNAPIQGSASDIVKVAMIRLDSKLREKNLHGRLLIQVHDELLIECPDDEVDETADLLVNAMENAVDIGIPLSVELKIGKNWADMF